MRELGKSLMIFKEEKTYLKTAKFMDIYCLDDKYLWINMEQFVVRKESLFTPRTQIAIMGHFAAQQEGSRDFYDFFEFLYSS